MAAAETRLLLLGAVAIFEPVNGYQIRRELMSWGVESWANVRPGSIYHGLASLAQHGELDRHDLRDGTREVAVYESTPKGRAKFLELMETALVEVSPTSPLAFQTAFTLLPLLRRTAALQLLGVRRVRLREELERGAERKQDSPGVPPHVHALMDYWRGVALVERDWLEGLLAQIETGGLNFAGEPWGSWAPPADDPGWAMEADRKRYLSLLGRSPPKDA